MVDMIDAEKKHREMEQLEDERKLQTQQTEEELPKRPICECSKECTKKAEVIAGEYYFSFACFFKQNVFKDGGLLSDENFID